MGRDDVDKPQSSSEDGAASAAREQTAPQSSAPNSNVSDVKDLAIQESVKNDTGADKKPTLASAKNPLDTSTNAESSEDHPAKPLNDSETKEERQEPDTALSSKPKKKDKSALRKGKWPVRTSLQRRLTLYHLC